MARIEELIGQIADPRLRAEIAAKTKLHAVAGARSTLGSGTNLDASFLTALELFNARQGQE